MITIKFPDDCELLEKNVNKPSRKDKYKYLINDAWYLLLSEKITTRQYRTLKGEFRACLTKSDLEFYEWNGGGPFRFLASIDSNYEEFYNRYKEFTETEMRSATFKFRNIYPTVMPADTKFGILKNKK